MTTEPKTLSLADYAAMAWHRKFLILLLMIVMAVPAAIYSGLQTPVYTAAAQIALTQRQVDTNLNVETSELTDTAMSTQTAIITGDEVTRRAIARGATVIPRAQTTTKTNLIDLTAQAPDAGAAAASANAFADAYLDYRIEEENRVESATVRQLQDRSNQIQARIDDLTGSGGSATSGSVVTALGGLQQQQSSVQGQLSRAVVDQATPSLIVNVVHRAEPPAGRTSPDPVRAGLLGLVLGLFLGTALSIILGTIRLRSRATSAVPDGPGPAPDTTPVVSSAAEARTPSVAHPETNGDSDTAESRFVSTSNTATGPNP